MLQASTPKTPVGVIIGRFQVHELHEGHIALIDTVNQKHKKLLVLIGSCPTVKVTRNNPLDYQTRMLMVKEAFPNAIILPVKDTPSDEDWSKAVDTKIEEVFEGISDSKGATIYGSRDAFIPYYAGKYGVVELDPTVDISGTMIRQEIGEEVKSSPDFRRGVVYAAYNQHARVMPTVDIACIKKNEITLDEIALVRKKNDIAGLWRFPGGFLDPRVDDSIEQTASREIREETGLEVSTPQYIQSFKVDDWRYRKEIDKIFTCLFMCTYVFGNLEAKDDINQASWFPMYIPDIDNLVGLVIPEHRPLMVGLLTHLKKESEL